MGVSIIQKLEKEKPLLIWVDGSTMPNPELAAELLTTYGVSPETFIYWLNEKLKNPLDRAYWTARAYDGAHGTQHRLKIV